MPNFVSEIRDLLSRCFAPADPEPLVSPLESCIVAILSPRASSKKVEAALSGLRVLCGNITCERLSSSNVVAVAEAIRPAGQAAAKAARLLGFVEFVMEEGGISALENSRTENLRERLSEVRGLGPETVDAILLTAFGRPVFPVSRAAFRVLVRHRLVEEEADYECIRKFFENRLEEDPAIFRETRAAIARVGMECCDPSRPRCEECPLKDVNGGPVLEAR